VTNGNESSDRLARIDATLDRVAAGLDRLTERHEALSQTVELIAGMQAENEKRIAAIAGMQVKNEKLMGDALEAIHSLARIAQAHEQRLDNLEG